MLGDERGKMFDCLHEMLSSGDKKRVITGVIIFRCRMILLAPLQEAVTRFRQKIFMEIFMS